MSINNGLKSSNLDVFTSIEQRPFKADQYETTGQIKAYF